MDCYYYKSESFFRAMEYDMTVYDVRLNKSDVLSVETVSSRKQCSMKCNLLPDCQSFVYCNDSNCQLNSNDIYADNTALTHEKGCLYKGMQRNTQPKCLEGAIERFTVSDVTKYCRIQNRATLPRWGDVIGVNFDWNGSHIEVKSDRECLFGAHIANTSCDGPSEVVSGLLSAHWQPKGFWDAYRHCQELNSQLFGDVLGNLEVLEVILDSLDVDEYWLGVSDWEQESVFRNFRGQNVTGHLPWFDSQPGNEDRDEHYVAVKKVEGSSHALCFDQKYTELKPFVCQLMFASLTDWKDQAKVEVYEDKTVLVQTKECQISAMGKNTSRNCEGATGRNVTYLWGRNKMSFSDAKDHCRQLEATHFDGLNGSVEQMLFLGQHVVDQVWMGVQDEEEEGKYVNMQGQDVESLKWHPAILWSNGEPMAAYKSFQDFLLARLDRLSVKPDGRIIQDRKWTVEALPLCLQIIEY